MNTSPVNWETSRTGNNIVIDGQSGVICTVFEKPAGFWRVVINVTDTHGANEPHFVDEDFSDVEAAKEHAETLLPIRDELKPTPSKQSVFRVTPWREQNKRFNGQPTYGRQFGHTSVTVKCSTKGSWFYVPYGVGVESEVFGWFTTPDAAKVACDTKYMPG